MICNDCANKHCSWKHWMYQIAKRTRKVWDMFACVNFRKKK